MNNQFFKDLYKKPDPIDETVDHTNDQLQNDELFKDKIPLAAAQIESPVKETENQFLNQDPYDDAIPLAAAQIESPVKETDHQYLNPNPYTDVIPVEADQIESPVKETDHQYLNPNPYTDVIPESDAQIKEDVTGPDDQLLNRNRFEDDAPMDSDVNFEEPKADNVIVIDPIDVPVSDELQGIDIPNRGFDTTNSLLDETIPAGILVGNSLIDKPLANKPVPSEYSIGETPNFELPADKIDAPKFSLGNLEDSQPFHDRWNEIQGQFVDDPKDAVMQADVLVSEIIEKIKQKYDNEHETIKNTWSQSNDFSTEDLRTTLQKYHTLVDLLLA